MTSRDLGDSLRHSLSGSQGCMVHGGRVGGAEGRGFLVQGMSWPRAFPCPGRAVSRGQRDNLGDTPGCRPAPEDDAEELLIKSPPQITSGPGMVTALEGAWIGESCQPPGQ